MRKTKLDEMEKAIIASSTIYAYRFMLVVLIVWCIVAMFTHQNWGKPFYIIIAQALVKFIAKQINRCQVGDERWKKSIINLAIIIAIVIFIILFVIPISLIGVVRG